MGKVWEWYGNFKNLIDGKDSYSLPFPTMYGKMVLMVKIMKMGILWE